MPIMNSEKVTLEDQVFLDRLREGIPPEVQEEDSLEQLREFSQWLLVVPLIMVIIFGCGQLALFTTTAAALAESPSSLVAEYGPWSYVPIRGISGEIVNAIRQDIGRDEHSADIYSDPVEVASDWVDGELPPIIVVQLPSDEPQPTESSGGGPNPGDNQTPSGTPSATSGPSPTFTLTPTNTEPAPPTATLQPTSTDNPAATRTHTPVPSNTPTSPPPTSPGDPTWTPSPTATNTSTPTRTPTATNTPTITPTPPPVTDTPIPPPDYCSNISWGSKSVTDWQGMGTVIKFDFQFKNNNSIPMSLSSYTISWTDSGLSLHRAKADLGNSTKAKIVNAKGSSPASWNGTPANFIAQPGGQQEIYNMFCVNTNCVEEDPDGPQIGAGTYTFTATVNFSFNGGAVNCGKNRSGSITMP